MEYTDAQVLTIAKKQKILLWLILASIAVLFARIFGIGHVIWSLMQLSINIINLVFIYQLATALNLRTGLVWGVVVAMLVPIVNIILLLAVNGKATGIIRGKGIKVGLMGADKAQLIKLGAGHQTIENG